jgi:hypothetical protein
MSTTAPDTAIEIAATAPVRKAMAAIGRTEDVRFSPDGRLLAIAEFLADRIILVRIHISWTTDGPAVRITHVLHLYSKEIRKPHGLDFIDDERLVVASRSRRVALFAVPRLTADIECRLVDPLCVLDGPRFGRLFSPGSVVAWPQTHDRYRILVCNNFVHRVSAHDVVLGSPPRVVAERRMMRKGLRVPDGIAVSPDRRWIAVSNHVDGTVRTYRNDTTLGASSRAHGILSGSVCPHGLRFLDEGRRLLVADAGSPFAHVYDSPSRTWDGTRVPQRSLRMMSDAEFDRGHRSPIEGGNKGIDVDPGERVLVCTREHEPLGFHDLRRAMDGADPRAADLLEDLIHARERELGRMKHRLARVLMSWPPLGRYVMERSYRLAAPVRPDR